MNLKRDINGVRRKIMRSLTKNVGTTHFDPNIDVNSLKIKRILICRPNPRLGNQLLITPLVQEVIATFPDCDIDLFVNGGLSPIVFKNYENVKRIIQLPRKPFKELVKYSLGWLALQKHNYDIVVNVVDGSSSGRLSAKFAHSKYKFFGDEIASLQNKYPDYSHIAKHSVYNFRYYLTKLGFKENDLPVPSLNILLSEDEIEQGQKALSEIVPKDKKTIALFTFATGEKCYSEAWWEIFYERLKLEYTSYNIVEVLPVENVSQLGFTAPTFYSKDIREIASLIANTEVFIGADSGIMHLASASLTPTVGLFSRGNSTMYAPYGNSSTAIETNKSTIDDWIKIIDTILKK